MGTIHRALKIRIYPSQEQETQILKTIGSCRFLYNNMLAEKIKNYESWKSSGQDKKVLFNLKYKTEKQYKEEFEFLSEVSSAALQQSRMDLSSAYINFFKSLSGKRKGNSGFPKFHKKGRKDSYREVVTNNNVKIDFESKKVKLPKIGWITFRDLRTEMKGEIKQATVSRTATGKYFVSILFEQELVLKGIELNTSLKTKGLDMSLNSFFVDDEGNSPAYERIYRNFESRLKFLQRRVSKKKKGSKNRLKAQLRVNLLHEQIANKRKDFTHKLSTELVRNNDVIVVENLNLRAMAQCLKLGKSVNDLGYGAFLAQLKYKTLWNNKILIEADKWFASSKTCCKCGFVHKNLQLQDRVFNCPSCSFEIDRDQNAGINLKNYGLRELGLGQPNIKPVEMKTKASKQLEVSLVEEAGRSPVFSG
jgi:putative transposase